MSPQGGENSEVMPGATDIEEVAAEWFGRKQFWRWTDENQRELDAWLGASLTHQVAYWRIAAAWQRTERLHAIGLQRPRRSMTTAGYGSGRVLRYALAAVVLVGLITLTAVNWSALRNPGQVYTTGLGETRSLVLSDGSRIELNTNSALRVNFSDGERQVALEQGEAYFQIQHNPKRPFTVLVNQRRITDLGTKFLVREDGSRLRVTLIEGKARLDSGSNGMAQSAVLTPGDVAIATQVSLKVTKPASQSITNALAWRNGVIVLGDHATLSDAVSEFNRYNRVKLVVDDPTIAKTPIAGRFPTDGVNRFADVVTHVFGYRVRAQHDTIVITR